MPVSNSRKVPNTSLVRLPKSLAFSAAAFAFALSSDGSAQVPAVQTWRITEDLRISGSAESLDNALAPIIMSDGTIVVADWESGVLSFFGSDGRRTARVGAKGRGPGELVMWAFTRGGIVGDSVWFADQSSKRLVVYSAKGKPLRSSVFPRVRLAAGLAGTELIAIRPDGSLIAEARPTVYRSGRPLGGSDTAEVILAGPSGAEKKRLGVSDQTKEWVFNGGAKLAVPFVVRPLIRPSRDGSFVLFMSARRGRNMLDTVVITVVRHDGDTAYLAKQVLRAERIPDSVFNAERKLVGGRARSGDALQELQAKMSRSYPVVDGAIVTSEGRTWLRLRPSGGIARYLVISPSGKPEGIVSLPAGVIVIDALGDRLWGFEEDGDGFNNLLRFKVDKR